MIGKELRKVVIGLIVLHAKKNIYIYLAYVSKYISNLKNQVTILIIQTGEKWNYLAIKKTISIIKRNNIKK